MIKQTTLLDVTLATQFTPGTNVKGEVTGANWLFLLPSLALGQTLCLGTPRWSTLLTLSRASQRVVILDTAHSPLREKAEQHPLENIVWHADTNYVLFPLNETFDLIVIANRAGVRHIKQNNWLLAAITKLCKPDGMFYWEDYPSIRRGNPPTLKTGEARYFWLTPLHGEAVTAVPLQDRQTIDYFLARRLFSPSVQQKAFKPIKKMLQGESASSLAPKNGEGGQSSVKRIKRVAKREFRQVARVAGKTLLSGFERAERALHQHTSLVMRSGVLTSVAQHDASTLLAPPQYLRTLASNAGLNIEDHRWGVVASGEYSSRKVLCFLFPERASTPEYVVKMVRDPRFNLRLENEVRALTLLHENDRVEPETIPQVAFWGHHARLAIVGETHVEGVPFRERTTYREDCPYALEGIQWITDLGAANAPCISIDTSQVSSSLTQLFRLFTDIYPLSTDEQDFMSDQLDLVDNAQCAFPIVFQHGDPGVWNILVKEDGKLAFLDWEAAEPLGLPLWDLFYFLRSYAVSAAKSQGISDRVHGFKHHFLEDTSINRLIIQVTGNYAARIGLPSNLIQPLFYLCWMHRALKEAARLPVTNLSSGYYFSLLRLCIQQQHSSVLNSLLRT